MPVSCEQIVNRIQRTVVDFAGLTAGERMRVSAYVTASVVLSLSNVGENQSLMVNSVADAELNILNNSNDENRMKILLEDIDSAIQRNGRRERSWT